MKFYLLAAVTIVMVVQAVKATDLEDTVSLLLLAFFTILSLQRQKNDSHIHQNGKKKIQGQHLTFLKTAISHGTHW